MTAIISRYGALGVFALMVPESACIPLPSEVTLLFSGFAVRQGWMTLPAAVLAATAGNVLGSLIAYGLGASRTVGRAPALGAAIRRCEGLFDRHGSRAVFLARLLPLARTFVSLPAGSRRIPLFSFVLMTTAGCGLWAVSFVVTGVLVGAAWSSADAVIGRVLLVVGIAAVGVLLHRGRPRRSH